LMRKTTVLKKTFPVLAATMLLASGAAFAQLIDPSPIDCAGPAGEAEPGTDAWRQRDAANMYCSEQRHLDSALHPLLLTPIGTPVEEHGRFVDDPYREPSRHAGVRFRFDAITLETGGTPLAVEIYRPCAAGTCSALPGELQTFEPPYPAVVSIHGGASRKELHWWSSQPMAEAGYMVISFDDATTGTTPSEQQVNAVLNWLFATPEAPAFAGQFNPFWQELQSNRVGIVGHSAGGVLSSRLGQSDSRLSAVVSWDRAQSGQMPTSLPMRSPALFFFADYNCQAVPVCQPTPYQNPPNPDGPGNKGEDFVRLRAAGVDSMQIALRAALHLDWTPPLLAGNRYAELVNNYFTIAWFDRYLKGADDPVMAEDAYARLTAPVFDNSADRHNLSQGFWDPVRAVESLDPLYGGNVPYTIEGMPVADRLSFYFLSKCFITAPGTSVRAESDDMRKDGCVADVIPPPDTDPDPFEFTNATMDPDTIALSETVAITGINVPVAVSMAGHSMGRFRVNGGEWRRAGTTVQAGDTVQLRLRSDTEPETDRSVTLTVGDFSTSWTVSTGSVPSFSFIDVSQAADTVALSETVTINGLSEPRVLSMSGHSMGRFRVNGGEWRRAGLTVQNGDTLQLRLRADPTPGIARTVTVEVGGYSTSWTVTAQ
jgi:pimeloyl-ACP methyl ester carboxylesterase